MSEVEPLKVTLELPAGEFMDYEGGLLVRCQKCRKWIPLADYYSEKQGQLLPLVGNAICGQMPTIEYFDTGDVEKNQTTGLLQPKIDKQEVEPCGWKETVRILEGVSEPVPEGGILAINVHDKVDNVTDKFGG